MPDGEPRDTPRKARLTGRPVRPARAPRVPGYCHHKPSGRAYVRLDGHAVYLGTFGTEASRAAYDRVIAEWLASGRRLPDADEPSDLSVDELIAAYWQHVQGYYRKNGKPTEEQDSIRQALKPVRRLYGETRACDFGPKALKAARAAMIHRGHARTAINRNVHRIRGMFRWGVEEELVPAAVYDALRAVAPLKVGRTAAREQPKVRPVADDAVDAVIAHVSPTVAAMIRLQRLTGLRSGELVIMRTGDIDRSGDVWVYRPREHKTEHHGHERIINFGPQAQLVLAPFLRADPEAFIFSPRQAEAERRALQAQHRTTPKSCGNRRGTNRKRRPKWEPGRCYTNDTYRRAVIHGCDQAFIPEYPLGPADGESRVRWMRRLRADESGTLLADLKAWRKAHRWHPHRLRHSYGTKVRQLYGAEASRLALGHKSIDVTLLYAEPSRARCQEIAKTIG